MEKQKTEKTKKSKNTIKTRKNIIILIVIGFIIILFIICGVSNYQNNRYNDLKEKYSNLKDDYSEINKKYKEATKQKEKEEIETEIADLNSQKDFLQNEVDSLTEQKNQLNSEIVTIKGQPLSFPAGYFTAGTDFEPGRYKIYDGNSNFVVTDIFGDLKVNIILGSDLRYDVSEYIYEFKNGDKIEADSGFKLVLVS